MPLERAVVGVVGEQVRVGLGISEIVEGDDLHIAIEPIFLVDGAIGEATDAAETVDADTNGHGRSPNCRTSR